MAKEIIYLTAEGYKKLKDELDHMRSVERPAISAAIAEARDKGDLSENAEYDAAKNEEALNESEIRELENMIKNAKIMEESTDNSKVHFGNTVTVYDYDLEETVTYTLMGSTEADLEKNIISIDSPFGAALVGARVGEKVTVHAPGGFDYEVEIKEIR